MTIFSSNSESNIDHSIPYQGLLHEMQAVLGTRGHVLMLALQILARSGGRRFLRPGPHDNTIF